VMSNMQAVTGESEFVTWAERELRRAGLFDDDSDYNGMVGNSTTQSAVHS
jgi:hypothetical protein